MLNNIDDKIMNTLAKLVFALIAFNVTSCTDIETKPVSFEFRLLNAQGIETSSFKIEDEIIFRFTIKNNSGETVKWNFLPDEKITTGLLPKLKRDDLLFDVFQDSTYVFLGKPYSNFITTAMARPYEEIAPHSTMELQISWKGDEKFFKGFPNYGFVFTSNQSLPKGNYLTGVAKVIEVNGIAQKIYLVQKFSVN